MGSASHHAGQARAPRTLVLCLYRLCDQSHCAAERLEPARPDDSSGTSVYQALNSVSAYQNFTVNGNADVTFIAGNFIDLGIGFHATAASGARFQSTLAAPREQVGDAPPS